MDGVWQVYNKRITARFKLWCPVRGKIFVELPYQL
jgi:hypothetical protein